MAAPGASPDEMNICADGPSITPQQSLDRTPEVQEKVYTGYAEDGSSHKLLVRKKPRHNQNTIFGVMCSWMVEHQLGIAVNLLLLLALAHMCFPRARSRTRKFFVMSYRDPETGLYSQGSDDLAYIFFCFIVFTGLCAFTKNYILQPFAAWGGLKKKARVRFGEQGWLVIYYGVFFPAGFYLMYNSDYWMNLRELWTHFPTQQIDAFTKWFYLSEFAFWLHQIVVLNIEERRKDHWQMFSHHIITCFLISMSYGLYQTKVGIMILVLMDSVDIVFSTAKLFKYFGYQAIPDYLFGLFMLSWFVNRHVIYCMIMYSIIRDVPEVMPGGCFMPTTGEKISDNGGNLILANVFQPFLNPDGPVCFNDSIRFAFLGLLGGLEVIMIIWFGMIVRVAYRVVKGQGADDSRSDDESEEEEVDSHDAVMNKGKQKARDEEMVPLEEDVGAEGLHFTRRNSPKRQYRKASARASGISLQGHPDRKELLGRIGCEKQT